MPWVSLITDFGSNEVYVGQLKGSMLRARQDLQFIDFTHDIRAHDIVTAGWLLKNCYKDAPLGTIHVVSVLNNYTNAQSYLVFKYQEYYFVGPNNGIFSLAIEKLPVEIYEVIDEVGTSFSIKELYTRIIVHLASGLPLDDLGPPVRNLIMRIHLQPVINKFMIRGSVVYVDHYENVVINITRDQFEKARAGRPFTIYMKRNDPIYHISHTYQDVSLGDTLCLFNDSNYMEIAIHGGKAASMLGLTVDEMIQIDFHSEGS